MNIAFRESQRDSVQQPRVAEPVRLPWVTRQGWFQPQRGCVVLLPDRLNPLRVDELVDSFSQGSRCAPTLGWMTQPRWGSLAEQRRIVAKVDELMALVDALETQLAASRTTAANLLSALVAELAARKGGDHET